jgi:hypothetical protein
MRDFQCEHEGYLRQGKQWLIMGLLALAPFATKAVQPYLAADRVEAGDLSAAMASVEKKLTAAGFTVVGRHRPTGVEAGTVIVTDPDLLAAIREIGGFAIITAPIRIGVQKDGKVSTINPQYWWRAFAGENYPRSASAEAAVEERLHKALNRLLKNAAHHAKYDIGTNWSDADARDGFAARRTVQLRVA